MVTLRQEPRPPRLPPVTQSDTLHAALVKIICTWSRTVRTLGLRHPHHPLLLLLLPNPSLPFQATPSFIHHDVVDGGLFRQPRHPDTSQVYQAVGLAKKMSGCHLLHS